MGSSPGLQGAGVVKGISKSAERKVAQEHKVLERVGKRHHNKSCCKALVLDIDVAGPLSPAGVVINLSDGAETRIYGLAHRRGVLGRKRPEGPDVNGAPQGGSYGARCIAHLLVKLESQSGSVRTGLLLRVDL